MNTRERLLLDPQWRFLRGDLPLEKRRESHRLCLGNQARENQRNFRLCPRALTRI